MKKENQKGVLQVLERPPGARDSAPRSKRRSPTTGLPYDPPKIASTQSESSQTSPETPSIPSNASTSSESSQPPSPPTEIE